MDGIENVFQELFRKTVFASHLDDLVEDGVPSDSLDDSYVIIPLIFTDPAADLHSGTERIQDVDFPDHHKFSKADISSINNAARNFPTSVVMTTEKDCQRIRDCKMIPDNLKQRMFYAPIKVNFFSEEEQETFSSILNSYLR